MDPMLDIEVLLGYSYVGHALDIAVRDNKSNRGHGLPLGSQLFKQVNM